jgi:tripeptide aminopeptidase
MSSVIDRFLRYVKIDTVSDHFSESNPSTSKQFDLAKVLVNECEQLGLANIVLTEKCHVLAELPANIEKDIPVIGLNAHMDTSPDYSGANINPRVVEYAGGDIIVNEKTGITLSPEQFPFMKDMVGQHLIIPDGTTLLGADDKAGIAEIMSAIEFLITHPEIEHGTVKICFTPDEEIGRGVEHFEYDLFDADFAFTIDGGPIGTVTYENFNAASAKINITGRSIHPGTAKGQMLNALRVAMELDSMLPVEQKPEYTEKYEGFFHLLEIKGSIPAASLWYIIRDHDLNKFNGKKQLIKDACEYLNKKYGANITKYEINDSYFNMKEKIEPVMHIIENAIAAMEELHITPKIEPIRGGTDGARMSYQGLPTPNLFYGGYNAHGPYEFAVVEEMELAVKTIVKIIERYAAQA